MTVRHHTISRTWPANPGGMGGRRARSAFQYEAYVPDMVASWDPAVPASLLRAVGETETACRELHDVPGSLDLEALARQLLRSEAVASSRIEGFQVSHRNLARAAATGATRGTAAAVIGNVRAMRRAIEVGARQSPVSVDDLREMHASLLEGTRDHTHGGVVRTEQNWIGGDSFSPARAEFIPPPAELVPALLQDLCAFVNRVDMPAPLQAAIAHVQFETIHPFADGNGRLGRALVHVVLQRRNATRGFVPPVSLALAAKADDYIRALTAYRYTEPDVWLETFVAALFDAAVASRALVGKVVELQAEWLHMAGMPRVGSTARRLVEILPTYPVLTLRTAMEATGASDEAVRLALARLQQAGVVRETTAGARNRVWECTRLFTLLDDFERSFAPPPRSPRRA